MNYVYILRCSDDTYYTGWTNNLQNRIKKHNDKKGAKYTRARTPVELVYHETYETRSLAQKREIQIKKMNRKSKQDLIEGFKVEV